MAYNEKHDVESVTDTETESVGAQIAKESENEVKYRYVAFRALWARRC
jgi:hypothetical protein